MRLEVAQVRWASDMTTSEWLASPDDRILVTGSNGFIGARLVNLLLEYGFTNIVCFVRPSSRVDALEEIISTEAGKGGNVRLFRGDLLSRDDCREAARGVSLIILPQASTSRLQIQQYAFT
jgi:nucleoside-diphosphate-sugar epimerase